MNELTRQIESHLRALQLKGLLSVYKEVAEKAIKRHLQYEEYLALLLEQEVNRKRVP